MIEYIEHDSPVGTLLLAATAEGVCGLYFEQHQHFKGADEWHMGAGHPILQATARQLDEYFYGNRIEFDLPLDFHGTPFQQTVWTGLSEIPYGTTTSYAVYAQRLGKPTSIRAIGTAIGRNPLCIIVPCHRVIGSAGALTGYAGGLERKRYLLQHEARRSISH